jgi:hypothetical protein
MYLIRLISLSLLLYVSYELALAGDNSRWKEEMLVNNWKSLQYDEGKNVINVSDNVKISK